MCENDGVFCALTRVHEHAAQAHSDTVSLHGSKAARTGYAFQVCGRVHEDALGAAGIAVAMLEIKGFDEFVVVKGDNAPGLEDSTGSARVGASVPNLTVTESADVCGLFGVTMGTRGKGPRGDCHGFLRFKRRVGREGGGNDAAQIVFEQDALDAAVGQKDAKGIGESEHAE
jgi:hypothetical protein